MREVEFDHGGGDIGTVTISTFGGALTRPVLDTGGFRRIRSRCSDAESINRGINDALPEGRARSYGFRGVLANALTHALVTNSVSRARFEARGAATEHRPAA